MIFAFGQTDIGRHDVCRRSRERWRARGIGHLFDSLHPQRGLSHLSSALVDIDAVQIVLENRSTDTLRLRDLTLFLVHAVEKVEGLQQEVSGPARRIEECNLANRLLLHGTSFDILDEVLQLRRQLRPSSLWLK